MRKEKHAEDKKQEGNSDIEKSEREQIDSLKAELNVLREEIAEKDNYYDKFIRLQAEFDNFRKRTLKEKGEFIKYANEALVLELVGLLDDFERSIRSADQKKDFDLLHQGVDMISRQLHSLLEEKGLKRIKSVGEKFNPHEHEAIEVVEDEEAEDNAILEELQPGWMLNGRIIRPAKVRVARNSPQSTVESPQKDEEEGEKREE